MVLGHLTRHVTGIKLVNRVERRIKTRAHIYNMEDELRRYRQDQLSGSHIYAIV